MRKSVGIICVIILVMLSFQACVQRNVSVSMSAEEVLEIEGELERADSVVSLYRDNR